MEILKPIAEEKEICILQELDKDIHLSGSVYRFRQMMLNLIENAIKYSYKGQKIWVRALKKDCLLYTSGYGHYDTASDPNHRTGDHGGDDL